MSRIKHQRRLVAYCVGAVTLLLAACSSTAALPPQPVEIEWFVGLGTGSERLQVAEQQVIVDDFNASQDEIELTLTVVLNTIAQQVLTERLATDDVPDIIGPIGRLGSETIDADFLDLTPWIDDGTLETANYSGAQIESLRSPDGRLKSLPFGAAPALIIANRAIFETANEPLPPTKFGEPYKDGVWDMEALRQLAMRLTLDAEGRSALDPSFDADRIVQWGFDHQWLPDARSIGTFFGAGALVADDGSATIPDHWLASWDWYHQLIWEDRAAPTSAERLSQILSVGNTLASDHMAMVYTHTWYFGSVRGDNGEPLDIFELAVPPEYQGISTSKLHTDTFRVLKSTAHPDEAVAVLDFLLDDAAERLLEIYGLFPARTDLQAPFEAGVTETFPSLSTVSVIREALQRPDTPSHESAYPAMVEARPMLIDLVTAIQEQADLDLVVESESVRRNLDVLFLTAG